MYIERDARAQANLRVAVVSLEAVASRLESGILTGAPPAALQWPELKDPFSGEPLRWEVCGREVWLGSVGPDGRAAAKCQSPAGDDVVVTFPLQESGP